MTARIAALVGFVVVATAGAAFGIAAVARGDARAETGAIAIATIVAGCAFALAAVVAVLRLPGRQLGAMLGLIGLLLLLSSMAQSSHSLPFTFGLLIQSAAPAVLAHLVLRFPNDRLHSSLERALVLAAYADVLVVQAVMLMFMGPDELSRCPCADNLLYVGGSHESLHAAIMGAQRAVSVILAVLVVVVVIRRFLRASPPLRRAMSPLVGFGSLWLGLLLVALIHPTAATQAVQLGALALVPASFLYGGVRSRLAHGSVSALLLELQRPFELRAALAEALGDPSLRIAYWVPQQSGYVDDEGRPTELTGGVVTEVSHAGRKVAALVHDPALAANQQLVDAVSAAAGMTLENERLQAELRAQLVELRASRARIVEAGDTARRRLERNLHDGAQQRLVALAVTLSLLKERLARDSEAVEILDGARNDLRAALDELRELARGLHPAVLDQGLDVALAGVAERSPVHVRLDIELSDEPPLGVAATVYYVVTEALTNVARYAQAQTATVRLISDRASIRLEVADDGRGGATVVRGSGLEGLRDRVEAAGGRLEVESPAGGGTRLRATLPF